jgi:1,4-alpha-glucan branching enzyme
MMEFSLFAPTVDSVEIIGSWSEIPLTMDCADDGWWRAEVELANGRHTYHFRLPSKSWFHEGEVIEIADPRGRMIDQGDQDYSVIVIENGVDVTTDPGFEWKHDGEPLPQDHELIIYELHIAEFGAAGDELGTFASVIDRLDYLKDLGITAIELMPVTAFLAERSWGYDVRHFFALEGSYGDPSDFKCLVDEAHGRGIRVLLDLVLNHSESNAPLTQIDFDYWHRHPRDEELSFGAAFAYEGWDDLLGLCPAKEFALEVVRFWIEQYHIDGYRLDATAMIDNFELVSEVRAISKATASGKPFFVVAEQLPEDPAIAGPDGPADGAWHQRFEHAVADLLIGEESASIAELVSALQPANNGYSLPALVVNYVESHDEEPLMRRFGDAGIEGAAAFERQKLAISLLMTAVGIPMLYQGQEFGGFRERDLEITPLQWELLDQAFGLHLKEHVAAMARLRQGSPALTGAELEVLSQNDDDRTLVYRRGFGDAEVIVAVNAADETREVSIPLSEGAWRELIYDYDQDAGADPVADQLDSMAIKVFVRRW